MYAKNFHIHLRHGWQERLQQSLVLLFTLFLDILAMEIADMFHIEVEGFNLVQVVYHWSKKGNSTYSRAQ